ncbi:hypothetical protein FF011L_09660 [Roseimaritima multifibrata]|uniref:Uncharacterized protein n=1 Tax=Roseimaritima multifibrata TaxID=1930274 RepID=A0A517MBH0_9BACT|nr:hypothetical protein [Roseimaritima multifibrata]QDS92229.1 hypothetical protein FF011L_09660 [Roseimaritima multifibrata]
MANLPKQRILDSRLTQISHSHPTKPEFVLKGIGPAEFRSHYLRLESGVVLDLFTAELTVATSDEMVCAGETDGIPVDALIGRTVTGVWNDDTGSCIVVLDHEIYLKDSNDGAYGNPLRAGLIVNDYTEDQRLEFTDYWTEEPLE